VSGTDYKSRSPAVSDCPASAISHKDFDEVGVTAFPFERKKVSRKNVALRGGDDE